MKAFTSIRYLNIFFTVKATVINKVHHNKKISSLQRIFVILYFYFSSLVIKLVKILCSSPGQIRAHLFSHYPLPPPAFPLSYFVSELFIFQTNSRLHVAMLSNSYGIKHRKAKFFGKIENRSKVLT